MALLDGALATELERRGASLDDPLWSARVLLDAPHLIASVHRDYLHAGADVVTSATYQATFDGFQRAGVDRAGATRLLSLGVTLARDACDAVRDARVAAGRPPALVAASIGPSGASLADGSEYRGDDSLSVEQLMDFHRPRMAALLAASPDLLAFETIPSGREVEAVVGLLAEFPSARAWISCSCRDGSRLSDGTLFAEAMRVAAACPNVVAAGFNCTHPRFALDLLQCMGPLRDGPCVVVYPNSGDGWDPGRRRWVLSRGVADLASLAPAWRDAGARLIGGCCRTTPDTIRAMAGALGVPPLVPGPHA